MKTQADYIDEQYSVAGLLVHSRPGNCHKVGTLLQQMQGVDVHVVNPDGKLVVTVEEQPGERFIIDRITQINNVEGVINTALVFSQSELIKESVTAGFLGGGGAHAGMDKIANAGINVEEQL